MAAHWLRHDPIARPHAGATGSASRPRTAGVAVERQADLEGLEIAARPAATALVAEVERVLDGGGEAGAATIRGLALALARRQRGFVDDPAPFDLAGAELAAGDHVADLSQGLAEAGRRLLEGEEHGGAPE